MYQDMKDFLPEKLNKQYKVLFAAVLLNDAT
jgi:hypothetical protein